MREPALFPMFLKLQGRQCLVVGGGIIGELKIGSLLEAGAKVRVVAPEVTPQVRLWADDSRIRWERRVFQDSDLEGCFVVVSATNDTGLNETVFRSAEVRGILCNVVDDPPRCDFYYPAVVRRGALQIAISTGGLSPALAQRLRRKLERQFGPVYADWLEQLGRDRAKLQGDASVPTERRRRILHSQASASGYRRFLANRTRPPQKQESPSAW